MNGEVKLLDLLEHPGTLQQREEGKTVGLYGTELSLLQVEAEVGQAGQVQEQQLAAGGEVED